MNNLTNHAELNLASKQRSLLYPKQKNFRQTCQLSTSPKPRINKSPTDPKYQTSSTLSKTDSKFFQLKSMQSLPTLKVEVFDLSKQIEKLTEQLEDYSKKIEILKSQNQDLISILLNIIESIISASKLNTIFKNKIVLDIKTTVVSKMEELSQLGFDCKNEIEQISLWGSSNTKENFELKPPENELHPMNPLKNLLRRQDKVLAVYDYTGEEEGDITFKKGDTIEVVSRNKTGWWKGKIGNRVGTFPFNFVEQI